MEEAPGAVEDDGWAWGDWRVESRGGPLWALRTRL